MEGQQRTAREHLDWCIRRALEYYDQGDESNALASFLSDVGKHEGTIHIQQGISFVILRAGMAQGRAGFEKTMRDFAIIDEPARSG